MMLEGNSLAFFKEVGVINPMDAFGYIDLLFKIDEGKIAKMIQQTLRILDAPAGPATTTVTTEEVVDTTTHEDNHSVGSLGDGSLAQEDMRSLMSAARHRALAPGMFATYSMSGLCELMLVGEKEFIRLLSASAVAEFQRRLEVVHLCGIFRDLAWQDQVRKVVEFVLVGRNCRVILQIVV